MTNPGGDERTPSVLIVEDEGALANCHAVWLEDDYEVTLADSIESAYTSIHQGLDVALVDRKLPNGRGDEIVEEIRSQNIDCRIAMVTAVDSGLDIVDMGFDDYLCKPVSRQELRMSVSRLRDQAKYSKLLNDFYTVVSKKTLLEAHCSPQELDERQEYTKLLEQYESLQTCLHKTVRNLDDRQLVSESVRRS